MFSRYATLTDIKNRLEITSTTYDDQLNFFLEVGSRMVENCCGRYFYLNYDKKYFTATDPLKLLVPDIYSVTTLKIDVDGDGVFEITLTENTHYRLYPYNHTTKSAIYIIENSGYEFPTTEYGIEIDGIFGFVENPPWVEDTLTATVSDGVTKSVILSDESDFTIGQTILIGTEQMLITGAGETTGESGTIYYLTVIRAINGTSASAHTAGSHIYYFVFPEIIKNITINLACREFNKSGSEGIMSETLSNRQIVYSSPNISGANGLLPIEERALSRFTRTIYY